METHADCPPEKKTLAEDDVLEAMWGALTTYNDGSYPNKKRTMAKWRRMLAGYGKVHHTVVLVLGNGHWAVESGSRPGEYHAVDRNGEGLGCTCEDASCRKHDCKHVKLIQRLQREEIIA